MAATTKVTLNKGGSEEKTIEIGKLSIPDLWHIAEALRKKGKVANGPGCATAILICWSIANDLRRHIEEL